MLCTIHSDAILFQERRKNTKAKYGKGGTFASAGKEANERALFIYWDTKKKREL